MYIASTDTVVIGAGVVGLATALACHREGREVVVLDPHADKAGTVTGSAATIAPYNCVPIGTPDVLKDLPRLLLDARSPLSIPLTAIPGMAPWLLRFAAASLPNRSSQVASSLSGVLSRSIEQWEILWEAAACQDLVVRNGALYLYKAAKADVLLRFETRTRTALKVRREIVDRKDIACLEPMLAPLERTGVYFPDAAHVKDPAVMMQRLLNHARSAGIAILPVEARNLVQDGRTVMVGSEGAQIRCINVVLAAGAWARKLAQLAGDSLPLDTERGYHIEYASPLPWLSRPVCPTELGFYMTPLEGRLRVAGTVEFGGVCRPPNPRRTELLDRGARSILPTLAAPRSEWLGFRPSMPDSLPVIGRASRIRNVVYAFGHGHLGLTLAAVTASMVNDLIAGRADEASLAPFSPRRFSWNPLRRRQPHVALETPA